jgi:hypothetical protein
MRAEIRMMNRSVVLRFSDADYREGAKVAKKTQR